MGSTINHLIYSRGGPTILFVVFLGFVVFWYLQGGYRLPALGEIRFELIAAIVLSLLAIPIYFSNPNRFSAGVGFWVLLLIVVAAAMTAASFTPSASYDIYVDRVLKFGLFGFLIAAFVTTPTRLVFFTGAFLLACLKMGQEGLFGIITGSLVWENQGIMRLHGSTPNYVHPNSYSGMAIGCLAFLAYSFVAFPRFLWPILVVHIGLMFNIVLFTGSRTGYVGLAFGVLVLIWRSRNRGKALLVAIMAVAAFAQFAPDAYIERVESIFSGKDKEGASIEAREQILEDAWAIFKEFPLGVGIGAFPAVRKARFGRSQDTHNLYFEILTNLGIQGMVIFVGFVYALLRALRIISGRAKKLIKDLRETLQQMPSGLEGSAVAEAHVRDLRIVSSVADAVFLFVVVRLALGLFGMDLYEIYWWFAAGLTVALWNIGNVACRRAESVAAYRGSFSSKQQKQQCVPP